jgi:hypothetical protein
MRSPLSLGFFTTLYYTRNADLLHQTVEVHTRRTRTVRYYNSGYRYPVRTCTVLVPNSKAVRSARTRRVITNTASHHYPGRRASVQGSRAVSVVTYIKRKTLLYDVLNVRVEQNDSIAS